MATPVLVNGYTGVQATAIQVAGNDCTLYGYHIFNASNAVAYVQFYDFPASVAPTVGTTVAKWVVTVPTLEQAFMPASYASLFFKGGLWIAATTAVNGSSNPSAVLTVAVVVNP